MTAHKIQEDDIYEKVICIDASDPPEPAAEDVASQASDPDGASGEAGSSDPGNNDAQNSASGGEDMAEIVVAYPSMGPIPNGLQAVEDAINEISETAINTHVTLMMIETGSYDQQMNLMLSSNESLDLMITLPSGSTSLTVMASQNQLTDLTELLPEYAPAIGEEMGELLKAASIDGRQMAVPTYRGCASGLFIVMRTDVLEDLGLLEKAQSMTSFTEYEEILAAVKSSEKWKNLAGIVPQSSGGSVLPFTSVGGL